MSGFFGSNDTTRWGGLLKQAISNVENTFDTLLEQNANQFSGQSSSSSRTGRNNATTNGTSGSEETEIETYLDPISGTVTSIQRPKRPSTAPPKDRTSATSTPPRPSSPLSTATPTPPTSDLSARLAAVMAEKARRPISRTSSVSSNHTGRQSLEATRRPSTSSTDTKLSREQPSNDVKRNTEETSIAASKPVDNDNASVKSRADPLVDDKASDQGKSELSHPLETTQSPDTANVVKETASVDSHTENPRNGIVEKDTNTLAEKSEEASEEKQDTEKKINELVDTNNTEQKDAYANDQQPEEINSQDSILKQRESQLFQAMQNIANLHDQIQTLREELDQKSAQSDSQLTEISTLQAQLAKAESSRPSGTSAADQRQIKRLEAQLDEQKQQLASKDEQIQGLLEEGEKLSKKELKQATIIKKLRAEKQEQERSLTDLQKKMEKTSSELVEANVKVMKLNESEKRLQESVRMLTDMTERQSKHISKLESDAQALKEQLQSTKLALESAQNRLEEERKKARAESDTAFASKLEAEVQTSEALRQELAKLKSDGQQLEDALRHEIQELQSALQTSQMQSSAQEDSLRQEISELRARLQASDSMMDDLQSRVEDATAPLLQQIEELQTQHAIAIRNRDQNEQRIVIRLEAIETERNELRAKLNETSAQYRTTSEYVQRLEADLEREREELSQLRETAEKHEAAVRENERLQKELDEIKAQREAADENIKLHYQKLMKKRLHEERLRWESRQKEEALRKQTSSNTLSASGSDTESVTLNGSKAEVPPRVQTASPASSPRVSSDHGQSGIGVNLPIGSNVAAERFNASIRHLENQISFYQTQLQSSNQSRDELSEEVLRMTVDMERLYKENKRMHELQKEVDELNERYQASLELLGERTEQVEELKADITDVKEMYRSQIVELVQKIDQLTRQ